MCADKSKKAKKALQWLRGKDADVTQEFSEIEKANHMGKNEEMPGYLSLFSKMYSKPLLISMGLMLFQQLSGINAVIFYTVKIFKVIYYINITKLVSLWNKLNKGLNFSYIIISIGFFFIFIN